MMRKTLVAAVFLAAMNWLVMPGVARGLQTRRARPDYAGRDTTLQIAFSADGLHFNERDTPFLVGGSAATMAVLPNGHLLAVVDYTVEDSSTGEPLMSVTRSRDGGRTWSPLKPVQLFIPKVVPLRGEHGSLVVLADGRVVLYFLQRVDSGESSAPRKHQRAVLRAAISRTGLRYRLLKGVNMLVQDAGYLTAWRERGAIHLVLDDLNHSSRRKSAHGAAKHLISRDGERFVRMSPIAIKGASFVGSVVKMPKGLRGFFTSRSGLGVFSSRRGRRWHVEEAALPRRATDPAVVQLPDGRFVMLYTTPSVKQVDPEDRLVDSSGVDEFQRTLVNEATGSARPIGQDDSSSAEGKANDAAVGIHDADRSSDGEDRKAAASGQSADDSNEGHVDDSLLVVAPVYEDIGFAPLPNWEEKIDYMAWYRDVLLEPTSDNAYDEYAKFMPDDPDSDPDWVYAVSMFNTTEDVEIGPWDPKLRPDWEKGNRKVQDILRQFRAATEHDGYDAPPQTNGELVPGDPDSANLLLGIILPRLSYHRLLTKMSLADAWREEHGKVSASKMLQALRTTLQNARHMQNGASLIEELVSVAQRALIYKNALAALKHGVFDNMQLAAARDVLRDYDPGSKDPMYSVRGEHAFAMDMTQYIFKPNGPDGKLKAVAERAKMAVDMLADPNKKRVSEIAAMTEEEVYETLEVFDHFYHDVGELMRVGYPVVRAGDVNALAAGMRHTSPLTESFTPSLGRYYKLKTRLETTRRATRLVYEVHLFRAQHGRWPASLDELPGELVEEIRIDPFSGLDFGYRLTPDGPTIYSVSDNGLDDGGIHSPRWGDEITNDAGSDDYVFWPVQPS